MKIALVCGHFIPKLGYIEVHLARAFAGLGHDVTVFTSDAFPAYLNHLKGDFGDAPEGVKVLRFKPHFELGQIVIARGLKNEVESYDPDKVIVIGLGKRFPKPVFDLNYPIITLLGDNSFSYASEGLKQHLLFKIFKESTYKTALRKSQKLAAYTPESFQIVVDQLGFNCDRYVEKLHEISLGYWSEEFHFDNTLRASTRDNLGYSESDKVVITATRIVPEKELERQIPFFKEASESVKWLLVGGSDDSYVKSFENKLKAELGKDRFMLLDHVKRDELNGLYNAADLALYTVPAISNFEALGTGLKLRIPKIKTLERLTRQDYCASSANETFKTDHFDYNRKTVQEMAEKEFDWLYIANSILVDKAQN